MRVKKSTLIIVSILVIVVIIFGVRATFSGKYDGVAQCMTEKGTVMYGAWWCPHCEEQKTFFGSSFKHIVYVECANPDRSQNQVCNDAGIESYPTWEFGDGERHTGQLEVEELADRAGCEI